MRLRPVPAMPTIVALALAFVAMPALATGAGDAPIATASVLPAAQPTAPKPQVTEPPVAEPGVADPTVAEQIDAYLRSSPALEADEADAVAGVVPKRDRRVHGEVAVGVGTGGYRSLYARADMPVGESGTLSVAIQDTRGRFGAGRFVDDRFAGDRLGGGWAGGPDRQRCDLEGLAPPRPLDMIGGPHGRCVARLR
ncbi:hypothetical protein [Phenylobacterium sp. SCN 70-31]|uniref:hypothetical protein n=1 Tax=Phenylobacterium sp. SCN 70-31 TaxID=1660129 RepID=UPI00086F28AB|nr:hypothetical protein [Phenylobacterium sp. SCN 70-31]ODT85164.1 MAG: hypothetical protein ABS78_21530 [Phenylobacterium sp. SCN 70-31]